MIDLTFIGLTFVLIGSGIYLFVNTPAKKRARFHDTDYLNFYEPCSNCHERSWVYEDQDYFYGKRMCLNCGLLQKGSHDPFCRWDDDRYQYFDKGMVDNPEALALEWKAKNKYEKEIYSLWRTYEKLIDKKTVYNYTDLNTPMMVYDSPELIAVKKRFGEIVYELKRIYNKEPESFLFFTFFSQSELFEKIKSEGYYPPNIHLIGNSKEATE